MKQYIHEEQKAIDDQPPSGGCVLKPVIWPPPLLTVGQPPSGGCVLKRDITAERISKNDQPPSGGCVLKQTNDNQFVFGNNPAAFGRLCVETLDRYRIDTE